MVLAELKVLITIDRRMAACDDKVLLACMD
jgi:hypothetical protein